MVKSPASHGRSRVFAWKHINWRNIDGCGRIITERWKGWHDSEDALVSIGYSDIGVTMNTYTHLGLEDAKEEMIRMEELNAARAELNKTTGEKPVTQKMFRAI